MTPYPDEFPFDALSMVTKALKAGDFSDVDGLALAAWNVVGFALENFVGSGEPIHVVGQSRPMSEPEAVDALDEFVQDHRGRGHHAVGAVGAFPIPWSLLISLGVGLIQKLIERKKAGA